MPCSIFCSCTFNPKLVLCHKYVGCSLRHIYFSVSCIFSSFIILFHFYAQKSSVVSEMSDVDGRIQEEHDKVSE